MSTRTDLLDERAKQRSANWRSKAVVACDNKGHGCVLWFIGEALENEINEAGLRDLGDLGLDDAPVGISIWEGSYVWCPGGFECPEDGTMDVSRDSAFRKPTDEEWVAVREGRNPWSTP